MSECKVKINVDICGESALDAVTKLVVAGTPVKNACIKVSEEFNAKNEGATVKWETLRKSYQRANKVKTVGHVPQKEAAITIPTVDEVVLVDNNTITISKFEYDILIAENEGLALAVEELDKEVKRLQNIIDPPKVEPSSNGTISREVAFEFVKSHGNQMQVFAITKDNPNNARLFNLFNVVRQDYLKTMPPHTLPKEVLEAAEVV